MNVKIAACHLRKLNIMISKHAGCNRRYAQPVPHKKNNSFSGQYPEELCRLKALHINYNEFEDGIPVTLRDLSKLQYLYLCANNFTSFIPQSIGNLQWSKELDTSHNSLSRPIPQTISNISSLKVLHLFSNCVSGTPTSYIMCHLCFSLFVILES